MTVSLVTYLNGGRYRDHFLRRPYASVRPNSAQF